MLIDRAEVKPSIYKNFKFWKKFLHFFLISVSALVLLFVAQTLVFKDIQDVQAVQGCQETTRDYPQCGGTTGLEGKDPTHTYIVREFTTVVTPDCPAGTRYEIVEDKGNLGQCQTSQTPTCSLKEETYPECGSSCPQGKQDSNVLSMVTRHIDTNSCTATYTCDIKGKVPGQCSNPPTQVCTEQPRDYPQCGASSSMPCNGQTYPSTTLLMVHKQVDNACNVTFKCDVVEQNSSQCGVTPPPPPPPPSAPSCPYGSTQARWQQNTSDPWGSSKTINLGQSANAGSFHDNTGQFAGDTTLTITGPGANTTVGNGGSFTPSQAGAFTLKVTTNSKSGGGCTDSATLTVNTSACTPNGSCSAAAPACGTTTTGIDNCGNSCSKQGAACAVTPPAGGPTNNTNNNTNNNTQNNNQNQTVNVTQSPAVTVSGAVPQVAGVTVTTLPKTGLPALAWSALAFIPAGFRMRRFNKVKKDLEDDPNYIWEDRKFKAGA